MDVGTQLVQAYLRLNGYLTVAEYPLVEERRHDAIRTLTDIDLLAVRFDVANDGKSGKGRRVSGPLASAPDPLLGGPEVGTDMIVAEVKQGRAFVNPATHDPAVLAAVLTRFGCCQDGESRQLVQQLQRDGTATSEMGHTVRMVLFAARGERAPHGWHWVHLDRVVAFVDGYLRKHSAQFGGVDLKDPALAWLALLQKCGFNLVHGKQP